MRMRFAAVALVAVGWLHAMSATTFASVAVTSAVVSHTYEYDFIDPPNEGTIVVLNSTSTGNNFTTFDGATGFTSRLGVFGGTFNINVGGTGSVGTGSYLSAINGTVLFTSTGPIALASLPSSGDQFGGSFTVRNLVSNAVWKYDFNSLTGASITGTLANPAPAGNYELNFTGATFRVAGVGGPGSLAMALTIVPEPSSAAIAMIAAPLLRRRV